MYRKWSIGVFVKKQKTNQNKNDNLAAAQETGKTGHF
jgi:hypothetical protein